MKGSVGSIVFFLAVLQGASAIAEYFVKPCTYTVGSYNFGCQQSNSKKLQACLCKNIAYLETFAGCLELNIPTEKLKEKSFAAANSTCPGVDYAALRNNITDLKQLQNASDFTSVQKKPFALPHNVIAYNINAMKVRNMDLEKAAHYA
jgi:hypothetical protein